jgi:hypothetical protein
MSTRFRRNPKFSLRSRWGGRIDPVARDRIGFHSGHDYAAEAGTPIPAEIAGQVVYSGFNENLGNTVIVKHHGGGYSLYAHMQNADRAKVGQPVWLGETIGRVGSTGARSTGNHVHYTLIDSKVQLPDAQTGGGIGVALKRKTTVDPDEYDVQPRYLNDTSNAQRLRENRMMGAISAEGEERTGDDQNSSLSDRFESVNSWPPGWSVPAPLGGLPGLLAELASDRAGTGSSSLFQPGRRAAQFIPANPLVPDQSNLSFEERFSPAVPVRQLSSRPPPR